MTTEMTNGELGRQLNELKVQIAQGFAGTNTRLDRVNGRLDTHGNSIQSHAVKLAEHGVKLSNIQHEVFARGERDDEARDVLAAQSDESKPITRRDLAIAAGAIVAAGAAIRWLPALLSLGQGAP